MELKDRIESCLKAGFHDTDKNLLAEIYKEVFSESLDIHCHKCIYEARMRLKKYSENKIIKEEKIMKAGKYKFKEEYKGCTVHARLFGKSMLIINEDNLTNEIAEAMLKNDDLKGHIEEVKVKEDKPTKA